MTKNKKYFQSNDYYFGTKSTKWLMLVTVFHFYTVDKMANNFFLIFFFIYKKLKRIGIFYPVKIYYQLVW